MDRKSLSRVEIKDADRGEVAAVFSTFDAVDNDGDVTLKGAFTDGQPVAISAYGHTSWAGELPVGKGAIRELETEAVLEGRFFMDTSHGLDTFRTVKALSEDGLQEWSYSLDQVTAERGEFAGQQVRFLKKIGLVKEVSPVLMGAGIATRTLDVKGHKQLQSALSVALRNVGRERFGSDDAYVWVADFDVDEHWAVYTVDDEDGETRYVRVSFTRNDDGTVALADDERDVSRVVAYAPKSLKFTEHADTVLADIGGLVARATEVMALRAAKGKGLAEHSTDQLRRVGAELERLKALLEQPAPPTTPTDDEAREAATREFLRFVARAQGAIR